MNSSRTWLGSATMLQCNDTDLEISAASDNCQGTHKHDGHDEDEADAGDVGVASGHPEHPGHGGEHPVDVAPLVPLGVGQACLAVGDGRVDGQTWWQDEGVPFTELCQLGLSGHDVTPGGRVVAQHGPIGSIVLPVGSCQLKKLDRVGLDVDAWKMKVF